MFWLFPGNRDDKPPSCRPTMAERELDADLLTSVRKSTLAARHRKLQLAGGIDAVFGAHFNYYRGVRRNWWIYRFLHRQRCTALCQELAGNMVVEIQLLRWDTIGRDESRFAIEIMDR